ncbi:MAG TPA: PA2169 family four-helix-bundle protein [Acidobacteriota bacterium]|nr:PA2169 family four-helix-bundle protein [Acidobacteriota bacterium]
MNNNDIQRQKVHVLDHLIQICRAGEYGFRLAAREVESKEHRELAVSTANKRHEFASALETQVVKLGGKPPDHATLQAGIHRFWMNLRHVINQRNDAVVLDECRRGEESALKAYQDVFEEKSLTELETMLRAQFMNIIETRDALFNILKGKKQESQAGAVLKL